MWSWIAEFHIPEKKEVVDFDSLQKFQSFYRLTETIHHVIVSDGLLVLY